MAHKGKYCKTVHALTPVHPILRAPYSNWFSYTSITDAIKSIILAAGSGHGVDLATAMGDLKKIKEVVEKKHPLTNIEGAPILRFAAACESLEVVQLSITHLK